MVVGRERRAGQRGAACACARCSGVHTHLRGASVRHGTHGTAAQASAADIKCNCITLRVIAHHAHTTRASDGVQAAPLSSLTLLESQSDPATPTPAVRRPAPEKFREQKSAERNCALGWRASPRSSSYRAPLPVLHSRASVHAPDQIARLALSMSSISFSPPLSSIPPPPTSQILPQSVHTICPVQVQPQPLHRHTVAMQLHVVQHAGPRGRMHHEPVRHHHAGRSCRLPLHRALPMMTRHQEICLLTVGAGV